MAKPTIISSPLRGSADDGFASAHALCSLIFHPLCLFDAKHTVALSDYEWATKWTRIGAW